MMARAGRQLAEAQRLQVPAHRGLTQGQAELVEEPLRQVLEPPAHDAMNGRNGPTGHDLRQGFALGVIELGPGARRLAVDQPVWAVGVEAQHPVAQGLQADAPDAGGLCARGAIIDLGHCQQPSRLPGVLCRLGQAPQRRSLEIRAQRNGRPHGDPSRFAIASQRSSRLASL